MAMEVVARDNWVVHSLIAQTYRKGRAFLVGDACHLHSPFGGHGMNLGIGDAVDLGWKLAAALEGWGSEGLLDSYEIERRHLHRQVIDSATKNASVLSEQFADPLLGETGAAGEAARAAAALEIERLKAPEFSSLGLVLGYAYEGSPLVHDGEPERPPLEVSRYEPSARPGHLAPHAWLSTDTSLYDRFGVGYTLLVLGPADIETGSLADAVAQAGVPLTVVRLDQAAVRQLYGADLVLVRPDQHVAWRGARIDDVPALIAVMTGNVADVAPTRRHA